GLQPRVDARPQGIEPQLLHLVRPPQCRGQTDRLRGMARLVIRKYPDHRWLPRRPSALIGASIGPPECRGTLKVELPAQGRVAPARRFEMIEPPFARAACDRQARPVREPCRCRVERYGCSPAG